MKLETSTQIKQEDQISPLSQSSLPLQSQYAQFMPIFQKSNSSQPQIPLGTQMSNIPNIQQPLPPLALSPIKEKDTRDIATTQPKKVQMRARKNQSLPTTSSKSFKPKNEIAKRCHYILQCVRKNKFAESFLLPLEQVSPYCNQVKEPMDLNTIEKKLVNNEYSNISQFNLDMQKIWRNALIYSPEGSDIYKKALELAGFFEKINKELDASVSASKTQGPQIEKKIVQNPHLNNGIHYNYGKITFVEKQGERSISPNMPMTYEEKKELHQNITNLPSVNLKGVWDIINESLPPYQINKDFLEFDLDTLPTETLRKLQRYANYHLKGFNKSVPQKNKEETLDLGNQFGMSFPENEVQITNSFS